MGPGASIFTRISVPSSRASSASRTRDFRMKPGSGSMLITRLLGIFAFACAAALLGCSSGSEPTAAESEALVCGTRTAITVDGEAVQVPAWVNARGINAKLRFYPGLAGLLGRDRIETCDDARAYEAAYEQYASQYPGFDDDEPYETRPVPP